MSWVQHSNAPQHTVHPHSSTDNMSTTNSAYVMKPTTASVANTIRPQSHASGALQYKTSPQLHQQNHFNTHQQQKTPTWQQQQQFLTQNKTMQPTAVDNWQHQQQQNVANTNVYQQYSNSTNNWQQPEIQTNQTTQYIDQTQPQQYQQHQLTAPAASSYTNYFGQARDATNYVQQSVPLQSLTQQPQQLQQQQPQQLQPQQLQPQQLQTQQPQPLQTQQHPQQLIQQPLQTQIQQQQFQQSTTNKQENLDNNSNTKTDGWGDWDWNDNNSYISEQQEPIQHVFQQPQQEHGAQSLQNSNINIIEDSFSTQGNDNWSWGTTDDNNSNSSEQHSTVITSDVTSFTSPQVPIASEPHNQSSSAQLNVDVAKKIEHLNIQTNTTQNSFSVKPTTLPISDSRNENFNNNITQPTIPLVSTQSAGNSVNNMQNSVYVSQAKPVSRPSRQFASPPAGNTPVEAVENALSPPQGFQNEIFNSETLQTTFQASEVQESIQAPPPTTTLPTASLPPSSSAINAAVSNPFKRTGLAQHHRSGFMPTAPTAVQMPALVQSNSFVMPPPPADFANPISSMAENRHLDNIEDLHENQEVIMPTVQPNANASIQSLTLQSAPMVVNQTHLANNERNQYLQTSPLSENADEDINIEGDNLPPPGLSRLVLGEPELEAPQRMVTGTEEPITSTVNLNIEERHADGEDTSTEQVVQPIMLNTIPRISGNTGPVPVTSVSNIGLTTDRNLYLVPGESNVNDVQRVVTGVETAESIIISNPTQIISEQREIELDGENLEDQQPLTVSSRDEPPLEGAASNVETIVPSSNTEPTDMHHTVKPKEQSNVSTGNDDSDLVPEHHRYANKSRKNNEMERKSEKQRRDKKRYESEESEVYSSDRERNERRRVYREGSVRSDRGRDERHEKERRVRDKRESGGGSDHDRSRDKYYRETGKSDRRSHRYNRYEADSKYETEESMRHDVSSRKDTTRKSTRGTRTTADERGGRSDRSDRDYDDYNRRQRGSGSKRGDKVEMERDRRGYVDERRENRQRRDRDRDRDYDYDTIERRRREKHHQRGADPRDYEEYRKQSSRNARGSDLEKERARDVDPRYDPRHAGMYGYHPTAAYGYDPYAYYYEQMARNNPQAYAEWYKKYYGHAAATTTTAVAAHSNNESLSNNAVSGATDGRESVHSGRSSVHNEKDRSGNVSLRGAEHTVTDPQRLTPLKFVNEHSVATLSAGILVTVKPKYGAHGNLNRIVKIQRLGANDSVRQLYQSFPGPLVRGLTHKKTIIEFCEEQIRLGPFEATTFGKSLLPNNVEKHKPSYTLMWHLLILLLRQNGMVVGTDIAELLLKNQQMFPYQVHTSNSDSTASNSLEIPTRSNSVTPEESENDENGTKLSDAENEQEKYIKSDSNLASKSEIESSASSAVKSDKTAATELEITEKFRNYLLYGNVNEALDWATDNNLWGHALFLASKVDRRSHANVMMKFANKLSLNDPLQTLYQLMSGRTPSSVTSVQDEKWGDWRPHLSMILSNTSQKPEMDRKAITTLGDSLFNRGDLFAAHFCYLMAQVGFGRYQQSDTHETTLQQNLPKLVLLGSSHYKNFQEFATNEAIMMTEIYEYACSLNDEKFSLVEFQPYKYLLATRMLDYGFHLKSLMYMEQISLHIQRDPSKYEPTFINKVFEFADRLKFYDPVLDKDADDELNVDGNVNSAVQHFEEQKWLQDLRAIAAQHKVDYMYAGAGYVNSADAGNNYQLQNQIDEQFVEINKQFNALNLQYDNNNITTTLYQTNQEQQQQQPMQQLHNVDTNEQYINQQQQIGATDYNNEQHYVTTQHNVATEAVVAQDVVDPYANYAQQYVQQDHTQTQQQPQVNTYYDPTQQQQQYNQDMSADAQNTAGAAYDYWSTQQQQSNDENALPTISMPKSKSYETGDEAIKQMQQQQQNNAKNAQQQQRNKNESKDSNKNTQQTNQNSGWFGGIWNKLSLKPKNQMILPDDKNPTIVWDPEKKRWVNTDGDENAEENLKPPPKMSDIMPQQTNIQQQQPQQPQQQQQQQYQQQQPQPALMDTQQYNSLPNVMPVTAASSGATVQTYSATAVAAGTTANDATASNAAATKPPSLQSNMFKMQRNRTLKNSYVDVFNPSGAPMSKATENVLAPTLPPAAVSPGGFFIPGEAPAANNAASYQQPQQQQVPQQDVPQFYNPNQFGASY